MRNRGGGASREKLACLRPASPQAGAGKKIPFGVRLGRECAREIPARLSQESATMRPTKGENQGIKRFLSRRRNARAGRFRRRKGQAITRRGGRARKGARERDNHGRRNCPRPECCRCVRRSRCASLPLSFFPERKGGGRPAFPPL